MMKNRSEIEVKGSVTNVEFFIPNSIPYIKIYLIHTHTHTHTKLLTARELEIFSR